MNKVSRKEFLSTGAQVLAGLSVVGARARARAQATRFNVLLILTDQERSWETLPSALELPSRYTFAERAVNFTNHHITTLSCGPSRATIFTGQHVQHTRVTENPADGSFGLWLDPERTPTIANMLRREGYRTAYKGKWHLSYEGELDDYTQALDRFGFDEWSSFEDSFGRVHEGFTRDPDIASEASRFIAERLSDDPWFLTVSLINPHDTMWFDATGHQASTRILDPFVSFMREAPDSYPYNEDLGLALPKSFGDDLSTKPHVQHRFVEQARYFYGEMDLDDEEAFAQAQNHYFNCLRDVDRHIGTILDALEASAGGDRTIVILTADHGEMGGAHKMRNKGPLLYRENLSIPFAVKHPDIASGASTSALMSSVDIAPTLLGLVGIERDRYPELKGFDFGPVLESPSSQPRRGVLFNFSNATQASPRLLRREMLHYKRLRETGKASPLRFPDDYVQFEVRQFGRGVFDGRYKFGRWFSPGDHHRPETWTALLARNDLELYDTETDPDEIQNLAFDPEPHKTRILELNAMLNQLIDEEVGPDDGSHMPGRASLWRSGP